MAHFTKEMRCRLEEQGWKLSQIDCNIFEDDVYSNDKYPGVYIKETAFGNFEIYSYFEYEAENEKIHDTYINGYYRGYNQGYRIAKIEFALNPFGAEERALKLYNLGYSRGYKIAKAKNPLNFFQRTKRKIKQIKEIIWHVLQRK